MFAPSPLAAAAAQGPAPPATPAAPAENVAMEAYGFAGYVASWVALALYFAWALLPLPRQDADAAPASAAPHPQTLAASVLAAALPSRYWALAFPGFLVVVVCSYGTAYALAGLAINPGVDALSTLYDVYSKPFVADRRRARASARAVAGAGAGTLRVPLLPASAEASEDSVEDSPLHLRVSDFDLYSADALPLPPPPPPPLPSPTLTPAPGRNGSLVMRAPSVTAGRSLGAAAALLAAFPDGEGAGPGAGVGGANGAVSAGRRSSGSRSGDEERPKAEPEDESAESAPHPTPEVSDLPATLSNKVLFGLYRRHRGR